MDRDSSMFTVEDCLQRLHRAGWSVGEARWGARVLVTGVNGENLIQGEGRTSAEAWQRACEQARAVGMLRRFGE